MKSVIRSSTFGINRPGTTLSRTQPITNGILPPRVDSFLHRQLDTLENIAKVNDTSKDVYSKASTQLFHAPPVSISSFVQEVQSAPSHIKRVYLFRDTNKLNVVTSDDAIQDVILPYGFDSKWLLEQMVKKNISFEVFDTAATQQTFLNNVFGVADFALKYIIVMMLVYFIVSRVTGGVGGPTNIMNFSKNQNAVEIEDGDIDVTFDDVAGAEIAKQDLQEVVEFLENPEKFVRVGANIPKGVLLYGPPGTGKTLLARAVAGEAGVPFISCTGSDFIEMFVGVGASRMRQLFTRAAEISPCIIFIDEIDAIGKARSNSTGMGNNDEREQTLNQLLTLMDGFVDNPGVIVIAATNRDDILDPALLRPGRFDRRIFVELPDLRGREGILDVHTRSRPISEDVDKRQLSKMTVGFSGADLESLCNEASIYAARLNSETVTAEHFTMAFEKITIGEKKNLVITDEKKTLTAYHEAGHTLAALLCDNYDTVRTVSIIPRGSAGGITAFVPAEDTLDMALITREYLENRIFVALGGRVAEEFIFGWDKVTTGASSDIDEVYKTAYQMVTRFGMSRRIGPINMERLQNQDEIEEEIKRIVDSMYKKCYDQIESNADALHALATTLVAKETMNLDDIRECLTDYGFGHI